ncbi:accessory Sec system glycosylation chaperone GtfB [Streptococcus uberis]|uniref:accessory Sec system glycosylation chaperone GtfB n=1 Tax=Streptococcus uberis TaxID=1349 RepID=UPI00193BFB9B|nr:accessory Sec system glycosylation chaperone GtfB [Streptococcus uberis]
MIRLFDWLSPEALDLSFSLDRSGFSATTVVLNDDGCLPERVTSPYSFFCQMEEGEINPLYFNQVPVPDFWEITANNVQGEIWNRGQKMGNIFYHEPKHKRLVKHVDWLDRTGKVFSTDHYNQYGWVFAKTFFDFEQKPVIKKYYDRQGQEVLLENVKVGSHLLNWNGKHYHFENKRVFVDFYLKNNQLDLSQIWYHSLGMPFMLSYYLEKDGTDILFFQEKLGEDIPGNMKVILEGRTRRTKRVIFQDKTSYEKALELLPQEQVEKIDYLGYLYPEERLNSNQKEILILTNSDQLHELTALVEGLKNYNFHIGALTEMSQRLMAYEQYDNVTLYPNISASMVEELFESCDIYLDINHGGEILNAVRRSFEQNLLVLAFDNICHNPTYTIQEHRFEQDKVNELMSYLQELTDFEPAVQKQRTLSGQEKPERYRLVLEREA